MMKPKKAPQWVEVGRRVDFEIEVRGKRRVIQVPDTWRLVAEGTDIVLVEVVAKTNPRASKASRKDWEDWTLGSSVDEMTEAKKPLHGPWKNRGKITRVWYDGRLAEQIDGPARRVHKFVSPFPVLQTGKNGPRVVRGASNYRHSTRGILG